MNTIHPTGRPIAAVGVVCLRGDDVLLIRRAKPPRLGQWSLPGGRIEWGERAADAALRELREETGIDAKIIGLIDVVDSLPLASAPASSPASDSASASDPEVPHYVLIDYVARWRAGEPRAGDDAADARFFAPDALAELGLWAETLRVITAARTLL